MKLQPITGMTWAVFFARVVLGLIFFMAGIYKVFQQGPIGHVKQWFLPYSNTFLPIWSLWLVGLTIPFVELLGGLLVLVGWRTRLALVALGAVLVTITFGHLLKEPLYAFHEHVIPRLALLVLVSSRCRVRRTHSPSMAFCARAAPPNQVPQPTAPSAPPYLDAVR